MVYNRTVGLTVTINRESPDPVYEQVADQVRELIASGALALGVSLPSVRGLARDLGVNLNTIARAYRLLESEGFLTIRNRAGVTVAAPADKVESSSRDQLLGDLRATLARLRQAGMSIEELSQITQRQLVGLDGRLKEACDD